HLPLGLAQALDEHFELPGRQHAFEPRRGEVTAARILGQVPDSSRDRHRTGRGRMPAHDHFGQGRLPRTVATDETDTVALVDAEGDFGHERACADGDFEIGGLDHSFSKLRPMSSARNSWGWMSRAWARATSSSATAAGTRQEMTVVACSEPSTAAEAPVSSVTDSAAPAGT